MNVDITYSRSHALCGHGARRTKDGALKPPLRLPMDGKRTWREWCLRDAADAVIIATIERRIVGFVRIHEWGNSYSAAGTWVHSDFRRYGLALRLWQYLLAVTEPRYSVHVDVVTYQGYKLVSALRKLSRRIDYSDLRLDEERRLRTSHDSCFHCL